MEPQLRRYVALLIAGAALIAAACRESVGPKPSAKSHDAAVAMMVSQPGVTSIRGNRRTEDNAKTFHFDLKPKGGNFHVGGFTLDYPANAVCDPETSSYGPTEWKNDCETITRPLQVTGKVWTEDGSTFVDFDQNLRFAPGKDVYLTVKIGDIKHQVPQDDWKDTYGIWYTVRVGDVRYLINDALDNPELTTVFQTDRKGEATGWVTRKIWHFSGYYVRAGRVCDDAVGDCSAGVELQ